MGQKLKIIIAVPALFVFVFIVFLIFGRGSSGKTKVVSKGNLETIVSARGEVHGEKSMKIDLAETLQDYDLRVWSYKIGDLVQEGKRVKKGDFIAQLDQSQLMNNMRERMTEKEKVDADLKNAIIDSTVNLTAKREDIVNARLDLQYKQIDLDMSKYESGAEQRHASMEYEKAQIVLDKAKRNYTLEQNKQKVQIMRSRENADRLGKILGKYQKALTMTRITSPGNGIVMIANDYMGKKLTKDSNISTWMPTLASLPDMSSAIVKTYIKEIDVTKVRLGDSTRVVIDALPDKVFYGKVIKIANMGEEKSGFDMKVFEVVIRLDHSDPDLKPGMACSSDIILKKYKDALLIPVNAVFRNEKSSFVYLRKGKHIYRKNVQVGDEDDKNVVVLEGLEEGDIVLLNEPKAEEVEI